ncbi:MAG: hypothetical protein EB078_08460 [Proteobacteria bacterium]|nr:hypothetical protein [Pseudomonadota bacterium]NDD04924.1 hypothetical protein [Pseudomonadota bacterium]NDG27537.1 hypothetical protein [Pseudomonadota bacterium]
MRWSFLFIFFVSWTAWAEPCFDLRAKRPATPQLESFEVLNWGSQLIGGRLEPKELSWGASRAKISTPFSKTVEWMRDHWNWKNKRTTKMQLSKHSVPGYFQFDELSLDVNVWGFIWISWREEWAYQFLKYRREEPEELLVVYQKTEGTSHLPHLCGMAFFKRNLENTDVFFYEEVISPHYGEVEIQTVHEDNIRALRKLGEQND